MAASLETLLGRRPAFALVLPIESDGGMMVKDLICHAGNTFGCLPGILEHRGVEDAIGADIDSRDIAR